jgi:hypothetical protein
MDTDTIVFSDLEKYFSIIQEAGKFLGLSSKICLKKNPVDWRRGVAALRALENEHNFKTENYVHYSSGMMIFAGYPPSRLHGKWCLLMSDRNFSEIRRTQLFDEITLSCLLACDNGDKIVWDIPLEVHGNLLGGRKYFGSAHLPEVLHYHNLDRLARHGYGEYACLT